ncbi:glyoxalase family protein [Halopolyspora algeriensis]|uniref:Glyoxalase family protein n=1 Tax=Halopolyspora algeriensis TaxID=1500506 RepID=A0A368VWS3_9ACTN|nr:ring-cleaving dioxygenase [Halopolyspora algeriensis]RCW46303.1 glyoxalase family protein [Halopolyspora algeriensis]TQM55703.1 glyoxalase family protein [Halopolyspora algeriensis]
MLSHSPGIHHVTAIATDPQRNADFYLQVLGLRMVKKTVNFDAPETYHLYYGDEAGDPGTILTFFPWPDAPPGRRGTGQATTTSFSVPEGALGWWKQRLEELDVAVQQVQTRSGEDALSLHDPDGLLIELVAHPEADPRPPWAQGPIPTEHAIRGLHSVTLTESGYENTAGLLTETLGFRLVEESADRFRFATGPGGSGAFVDLICHPEAQRGLVSAGTVHHVAWRTPNDDDQADWREELLGRGLDVTPIMDRQYFHSIYFREPGGVLLELATDPPGFDIDEPLLELGRALKLPPWLEPQREAIEQALPPLQVPEAAHRSTPT